MKRTSAVILALLTPLAGCSQSPQPAPSTPAPPPNTSASVVSTPSVPPPLIATPRGWTIPASDAQAGWHPTSAGVSIAPVPDAPTSFDVGYTRRKGTASGAAFVLPRGATSSLRSIIITASASPDQRLYVCMTDAQGVVWTFPTMRLTSTARAIELSAADVGPDPYQNAGKTPPPLPDWSTMEMLTILDISAHMGAPAVPCRWTVHAVEGVVR